MSTKLVSRQTFVKALRYAAYAQVRMIVGGQEPIEVHEWFLSEALLPREWPAMQKTRVKEIFDGKNRQFLNLDTLAEEAAQEAEEHGIVSFTKHKRIQIQLSLFETPLTQEWGVNVAVYRKPDGKKRKLRSVRGRGNVGKGTK